MEEFNLKATFKFIKRNFKVLAVTFVVSAVVTAGITLLLPNYYKAQELRIFERLRVCVGHYQLGSYCRGGLH